MLRQKNAELHSIADVVCSNTGMTKEALLHDTHTYRIDGLETAAQIIRDGIRAGKIFYIMGDFDVDGIMASAGMVMGLGRLHAKKMVRLPRRFTEGYGLQRETVMDCRDGQILITVDNGISSIDAVALAKEKGMTVIIIDHHLPVKDPGTDKPVYPDADCIIDPNAMPGSADFDGYCGAGLTFKLCQTLLGNDPIIRKIQSLAAVATVADSVPLTHENRRIVKQGMKDMITQQGSTIGLYALLTELGLEDQIDEIKIGYKLAPVLNAPGRLLDNGAMQSLMLMIYEGEYGKAQTMAKQLVDINQTRKDESAKWSQLTEDYIREHHMENDYPLVVHMSGIPEGIIGIIAGRMSELFQTPCILLGDNEETGQLKGSCRSDGCVDLKDLLDHTPEFLTRYGGHAMAAGIALKEENLDAFRTAAKHYLDGKRPEKSNETLYDLEVTPKDAKNFAYEVEQYAPYGIGNPVPTFFMKDLTLMPNGSEYYKFISGEEGVKLFGEDFDAVSFHGREEYRELGYPRHVSLYGTLSVNRHLGYEKAQMVYTLISPVEQNNGHNRLREALADKAAARA